MLIDTESLISASLITPDGKTKYVVVYASGHKTLTPGDIVVMTENIGYQNAFVRLSDTSIHSPLGDSGYVLIAPTAVPKKSRKGR